MYFLQQILGVGQLKQYGLLNLEAKSWTVQW